MNIQDYIFNFSINNSFIKISCQDLPGFRFYVIKSLTIREMEKKIKEALDSFIPVFNKAI